jgi:multidrug efflux pump subunit AcrA (membrane-fusion protein)
MPRPKINFPEACMGEKKGTFARIIDLLGIAIGIALIIAAAYGVHYVVVTKKKPGQMTLLESQAGDMSKMGAPKGSVPVAVEIVQPGYWESTVTYTGSAVEYNRQEVSPRITGWLSSVNVYPGDTVKEGQVLATIEARDLDSRLNEAELGYQASRSAVGSSFAMEKGLYARLQAARADLKFRREELKREEALYKEGAVSLEELQRERAELAKADAAVRESQAQIRANQHVISQNHLMSLKERAATETAAIFQEYKTLRAAIPGVVSERLAAKGSLISPGTVIYRITQVDPIRLQASVAQKDLLELKVGSPVQAYSQKNPRRVVKASITAMFPSADPESRTSIVEAIVKNPDNFFLPGEYIVMKIVRSSRQNALTVPVDAISNLGGKPHLWLAAPPESRKAEVWTCTMHPEVRSDKPGDCPKCKMALVPAESAGNLAARKVFVETGDSDGDRVEITRGLKEGDSVIVKGQAYLKENEAVSIVPWGKEGPEEMPSPPAMETDHEGHGGTKSPPGNERKKERSGDVKEPAGVSSPQSHEGMHHH